MIRGLLLGFLAFGLLAAGDGVLKAVGKGTLSTFEMGAVFGIGALGTIAFVRPPGERWRDVLRMHHPWLVLARSATGILAGITGLVAFRTIPFGEAYALIFLAPLVVLALAVVFLGERPDWRGWLALALGFAGVLLVVRPGLQAVAWGHASAFAAAVCSALTVIILRRIGNDERRTSLLAVPQVAALVANAVMAIAVGMTVPTGIEFVLLIAAGVIGAFGQWALLAATRLAPANVVAQTQYSQLLWAVAIGALAFGEYPDWLSVVGLVVIAAAAALRMAATQRSRRVPGS